MFVGFMLPSLPVGSDLHKAEFHVPQTGIMGSPYTKFGNLRTQHVNFAAFSTNTYNGTPLANLGDVAADGTAGTRIQDVTAAVESDYLNTASRGSRSQYRLEFPSVNDDGVRDQAYFTRTGFVLRLIYDLE
jgi:hypothetical protein